MDMNMTEISADDDFEGLDEICSNIEYLNEMDFSLMAITTRFCRH